MATWPAPRRRLQQGGYEGLAGPVLPQSRNGALDVSSVGDAVQVRVPRYTDCRISDSFVVLLNGTPAPFVPPPDDAAGGDITLLVPIRAFSNGPLTVRYGAMDSAGNGALSPPTQIIVSGASTIWLPPPEFPDFPAGLASFQAVALAGGVVVRTPCQGLQEGDNLVVTWAGYTDLWAPVPDMTRVLLSRAVTAADLAAGHIEARAQMGDVLQAGDGGRCIARYFISRPGQQSAKDAACPHGVPEAPADAGSAVTGASCAGLLLLTAGDPFILVGATSGAPFRTSDRPWLAPANRVWVAAAPFRAIALSVDAGIRFAGSDSGGLTLVTDAAGLATADIYQQGISAADVHCTVTATDEAGATGSAASVFTRRYNIDQSGSMSYGSRATAIAGGSDVCQISVVLPVGMMQIDVAVSGSALVNGYAATGLSLTHADNTCTISITNDVAETSVITLGREGGCYANFDIHFELTPFST